jgi:hypothetical protein
MSGTSSGGCMTEIVFFVIVCAIAFLAFVLALLFIAAFAIGLSSAVMFYSHVSGWECHITGARKSVERSREFYDKEMNPSV